MSLGGEGRLPPIAIVGIGCRLPGGVTSPESLWELLERGGDAIGAMPPGRFDFARFVGEAGAPGKIATSEGGYLQGVDHFDAAFFGISPREAAKIDPQHRLLLEVAWEAMEDGGVVPSSLMGPRTGVYVGVWSGEYENVMYRSPETLDFHAVTGGGRYSASGRLSWAFDLRGPCVTVDSGCSSALAAVHMAAQAIQTGDIDTAVVGAANLILQPHVNVAYSRSGMLAPGGRCRFGDAEASGYVRSDGVAVVILRSSERARAEGDRVRGRILGTAVNADGQSSGQLATPSASAQRELLETVYRKAGVDPTSVPYVEAHGTGTRAGDPVETRALGEVMGRGRPRERPLRLGSIKTNIGHTEACAGMAGLIKGVLSIEKGWIPASLHCDRPNPDIPWADLGLEIASTGAAWPADAPRIAGVSSFGITGTNAHAVIAAAEPTELAEAESIEAGSIGSGSIGYEGTGAERARARDAAATDRPRVGAGPWPVTLSARSDGALRRAAGALGRLMADGSEPSLPDLSFTTTVRRQHLSHRAGMVVRDAGELRDALAALSGGQADGRLFTGVAVEGAKPRVAFVFSGQGSQWAGMGRELMGTAPAFADCIHEADAVLARLVDWSLKDVLAGDRAMDTIDVIQPVLAAVQIAIARQLEDWGIRADAVLGHSMGEVPAAHIAGALDLTEAMTVLVARSHLLAGIAGQGAMALADEEPEAVEARLLRFGGRVSVAAVNGPRSTVVSGDPDAVDALLAELDADDVFGRRVRVDVASHSAQTEPLLEPLAEALAGLSARPTTVAFHSTVRAAQLDGVDLDAAYWASNLRRPVRLHETVGALMDGGVDVFVEIAPHPILLSSLADIADEVGGHSTLVPLLRRDDPEPARLLEGLARLHVAGVEPSWSALAAPGARIVELPRYPWEEESHWLEDWEDWSAPSDRGRQDTRRPKLADDALYRVVWESLGAAEPAKALRIRGDWVVIDGSEGLGGRLADALRARGGEVRVLPWDTSPERVLDVPGGGRPSGIIDLRAMEATLRPGDDAAAALDAACRGALELIRAMTTRGLRPEVGAWWITRGVHGDAGTVSAGLAAVPQGALWGLVRSLWEESPDVPARLVDIGALGTTEDVLDRIMDAVLHRSGEAQVAYREGRAHAARLDRAPRDVTRSRAQWRADATYLVTGGLGDLGLVAAEEMVRGGAGRLVLAGRRGLPDPAVWADGDHDAVSERGIAAVRRLEAMGAEVRVIAADVGDRSSLAAALAALGDDGWRDIRGVVHCAGVLDNHLLRDLTWDAFMKVVAGKAVGAWNLHTLLPDLDRMVLFSSVVPVLPQAGQANYAAANAFLDALAIARSEAGSPTVSLAWGVWRDQGLVRDEKVSRSVEEMRAQGMEGLDPSDGQALFRWTADSAVPHLVVASIDWAGAAPRVSGRPDEAFYERVRGGGGDADAVGARPPAEDLRALDLGRRRDVLQDRLRALASRVLGIAPSALPLDRPLGRSGLDSLMAMELRALVERDLGLRLPATLVWSYPTVAAMAGHLAERLGPRTVVGDAVRDPTAADTSGDGAADAPGRASLEASGQGEGEASDTPSVPGSDAWSQSLPDVMEDPSEEEILRMLREGG